MLRAAKELLVDYAEIKNKKNIDFIFMYIKHNYVCSDSEILSAVRKSKFEIIENMKGMRRKSDTDKLELIKFIIIDNL